MTPESGEGKHQVQWNRRNLRTWIADVGLSPVAEPQDAWWRSLCPATCLQPALTPWSRHEPPVTVLLKGDRCSPLLYGKACWAWGGGGASIHQFCTNLPLAWFPLGGKVRELGRGTERERKRMVCFRWRAAGSLPHRRLLTSSLFHL